MTLNIQEEIIELSFRNSSESLSYTIKIFNAFGEIIIDTQTISSNFVFETSKLPSGVYFIVVSKNGINKKTSYFKFVVSN